MARMWYKYIALPNAFYSFSHQGCIHVRIQVGTLHWIHLHVPGDLPAGWRNSEPAIIISPDPVTFRWHYAGGDEQPCHDNRDDPGNTALQISSIRIRLKSSDFASSTTCNSTLTAAGPVRSGNIFPDCLWTAGRR